MPELFRIEGLPTLQNRVYSTAQEAINCVRGDVVLVQSKKTGFIFNEAFNPDLLVYDHNYQNEQACSQMFRVHLEQVAEIITRFGLGTNMIEIGCGKGWFLEMLRQKGHKVMGVDPAYEGNATGVLRQPFSANLGMHGDLLILRHVLEHIQDPLNFLHSIAQSNQGGIIYIEVPCFDWIMQQRAWFDIFYEHVNYFRLHDFERMFDTILESGHLFGGQYLYLVADLSSLREPQATANDFVKFPQDFLHSVNKCATLCKQSTTDSRQHIAIWGAASKGVIFLFYMQRLGATPYVVIDINPAKQGKYLPATGLPVQSPAATIPQLRSDDIVIVMNGNYLPEIVKQTHNQFIYRTIDK